VNISETKSIFGIAILIGACLTAASATASQTDGSTVTSSQVKTGLDQYVGATELTALELKDLLSLVGFQGKSLKIAWAIAMKESNGHPLSHNKNASTGDDSYGLFQINMVGSLGIDRLAKFDLKTKAELLDPVTNAKIAYYMSAHGTDFGSWGVGPNAYDGSSSEPAVTAWLDSFPK
jgi:hypothetical protein